MELNIFRKSEVDNVRLKTEIGLKVFSFPIHPDHLGSSNYITNASGEVYQHEEYFPFGETFVEERNSAEYTTYLFNGKELDEETGLYYYGARYYDPRVSTWLGVDPLAEKYLYITSYAFTLNNPIKYFDPDGNFPMGLHKKMVKSAFSKTIISSEALKSVAYGASYKADISGASNSGLHLDNMSGYKSISSAYKDAKIKFISERNKGNFENAGEALHTIGDFYSHSNYLELYQNYAKENKLSLDVKLIPTFSEAMNDSKLKVYLEEKGLKTGTYGDGPLAYPKDKYSDDPNAHGNMNLDSDKSPAGKKIFSGKITMHEAAKAVAQKDLDQTINL